MEMILQTTLAGCAGVIGCLIGGTPAFIILGFAGIIMIILNTCGIDTTWFSTYVVNLMLLPAVIFNADVVAVAYTAKKGNDIKGYDTWRSLAFTMDPKVLIVGFITGVISWLLFSLVSYLNFPCDCGAFTVMTIAIITRLFLSTDRKMEKDAYRIMCKLPKNIWLFHIIYAAILAFVFGYFTETTGNYFIGFYVSAASLIFLIEDPVFPATHHITLVAGYTMMMTHNLLLAVIFGICAELMCYSFMIAFNDKCSTHIDPPTVPILFFSFLLFTLF